LVERKKKTSSIPVNAISDHVVILCARSAHTRPLTKNASSDDTSASFALAAAALNRFTFSCGVSPDGAGGALNLGFRDTRSVKVWLATDFEDA